MTLNFLPLGLGLVYAVLMIEPTPFFTLGNYTTNGAIH